MSECDVYKDVIPVLNGLKHQIIELKFSLIWRLCLTTATHDYKGVQITYIPGIYVLFASHVHAGYANIEHFFSNFLVFEVLPIKGLKNRYRYDHLFKDIFDNISI